MNKVIVSAKTVDEAIEEALKQLNTVREKVKVTILEEPSRGFFGFFGGRQAKVEVERIADPISHAVQFLVAVSEAMGLEVTVTPTEKSDHTVLDLAGEQLGVLIGRRGQTLDALQYLTNIVANQGTSRYMRFVLDVENYRQRRRETLQRLADRLVARVKRLNREIRLEPMNPTERKIIHMRVQRHAGVFTYSEGDEPRRRVVISPERSKM